MKIISNIQFQFKYTSILFPIPSRPKSPLISSHQRPLTDAPNSVHALTEHQRVMPDPLNVSIHKLSLTLSKTCLSQTGSPRTHAPNNKENGAESRSGAAACCIPAQPHRPVPGVRRAARWCRDRQADADAERRQSARSPRACCMHCRRGSLCFSHQTKMLRAIVAPRMLPWTNAMRVMSTIPSSRT